MNGQSRTPVAALFWGGQASVWAWDRGDCKVSFLKKSSCFPNYIRMVRQYEKKFKNERNVESPLITELL